MLPCAVLCSAVLCCHRDVGVSGGPQLGFFDVGGGVEEVTKQCGVRGNATPGCLMCTRGYPVGHHEMRSSGSLP